MSPRNRKLLLLGVATAVLAGITVPAVLGAAQPPASVSIVPFDVVQILLWIVGALGVVVTTVLGIGARVLKKFFDRAEENFVVMLKWKASSDEVLPRLSRAMERMEDDVREVRKTCEILPQLEVQVTAAAREASEAHRLAREVAQGGRDKGSRTRAEDRDDA